MFFTRNTFFKLFLKNSKRKYRVNFVGKNPYGLRNKHRHMFFVWIEFSREFGQHFRYISVGPFLSSFVSWIFERRRSIKLEHNTSLSNRKSLKFVKKLPWFVVRQSGIKIIIDHINGLANALINVAPAMVSLGVFFYRKKYTKFSIEKKNILFGVNLQKNNIRRFKYLYTRY